LLDSLLQEKKSREKVRKRLRVGETVGLRRGEGCV